MKKFIVNVVSNGKTQQRLIPARNETTAKQYCTNEESQVTSCVPYRGQTIQEVTQEEARQERLYRGCIAANRRKGRWNGNGS